MHIDFSFMAEAFRAMLKALPLTLVLSIVPLFTGFIVGAAVAFVRMYRVKYVHRIAQFYVSFFRGTPLLLHIMLVYFALPMMFDHLAVHYGWSIRSKAIPLISFIFVAFTLNIGAYMSETIRSGILAVSRGQLEAAYSVGMTTWQGMRRIVIPQALMVSVPNLLSKFIGLLHGSSLAFMISLQELTGTAHIVAMRNWKYLEAYIAAAVIYWILTIVAERASGLLEKRLNVYNRSGVV
ncbi:amino acid ABC transporter permease [Paenibacillus sp. GCM10023248]|uniref:amino acid ABC transporter permease n=1 Tax=unclassified Paenibacillus TaxID=185978 RepID=UPI002379D5BE|nr:amino acid ABC transporter permease [Paenibacillus sp. MAHUQ-63]MDD9269050.1 amino acid ABC transporter permease [Paenibacillus sp. MAHUQ-63]